MFRLIAVFCLFFFIHVSLSKEFQETVEEKLKEYKEIHQAHQKPKHSAPIYALLYGKDYDPSHMSKVLDRTHHTYTGYIQRVYTTDFGDALRQVGSNNYRYMTKLGHVANKTEGDPCKKLTPIYRLGQHYGHSHYAYTANDEEALELAGVHQDYFTDYDYLGYCVKEKGGCGATVPLTRYTLNTTDSIVQWLVTGPYNDDMKRFEAHNGISKTDVLCYIWE